MASLNVDFSDTIGRITPRFFGAGLEHVGANLYGGLWVGQDSAVPNDKGWRTDVLHLVQSLPPGLLRWPGGNFAQFYHWRDGVGPIADRPNRFDFFWAKPEPNLVGTDEFLDLCRLVDAEPSITVNSRTGTPAEAAEWVEYCNGDIDSVGGQRRAANGHPEPYKVRLWAIGSQSWEFGTDDAIRRYRAFARAMKAVDSSIQLIAVGGNPANHDAWDRAVVKGIEQDLDLLGIWGYDGVTTTDSGHPLDVHYANNASAERLLWVVSNACQVIAEEMPGRTDAGVLFDSWGFWRTSRQGLQHDYNLGDALAAATILNGLIRLADRARGGAWGNLVNALGLIQATERSCWTTPVYEALRLYRQHHGDEVSRSSVAGPAVDVPGGSAPIRAPRPSQNGLALLDVSATRDRGAGRFTLAVVNRSFDERIDVDLSIWGLPIGTGCTAYTLTGADVTSTNSLADPINVKPYEVVLGLLGTSYSFPAHSITVFVWEETPGLSVASHTTIEDVASSTIGISETDEVISPNDQDMISTLDSSDDSVSASVSEEPPKEVAAEVTSSHDLAVGAIGISVEDEIIAPSTEEVVAILDSSDQQASEPVHGNDTERIEHNHIAYEPAVDGDVGSDQKGALTGAEESNQRDRAMPPVVEDSNLNKSAYSDVSADPEGALTSADSVDLGAQSSADGSSGIVADTANAHPPTSSLEPHLDIEADPEGALEAADTDVKITPKRQQIATGEAGPDGPGDKNPAAEGVGSVDAHPDATIATGDGDPIVSPAEQVGDASRIDFPGPRLPGASNA